MFHNFWLIDHRWKILISYIRKIIKFFAICTVEMVDSHIKHDQSLQLVSISPNAQRSDSLKLNTSEYSEWYSEYSLHELAQQYLKP